VPDPITFDELFLAERDGVVALVYVLAGSQAVAEDLAQEAFLRLHLHWSRVSQYDRPEQWLRRVAVNLAVTGWRRRATESRALARLDGHRTVVVEPIHAADAALWAAVRTLPRRQAQAVALHYVTDMSVADVARALGCSEGTIQTHLFRARRTLADIVERREVEA
jgi:RNA polymerase sigma-70 factor, ECF subfamily